MSVGYFCASARIKFDDEQFEALYNELMMSGNKEKLMQNIRTLIEYKADLCCNFA
jgi:hypothetical protein